MSLDFSPLTESERMAKILSLISTAGKSTSDLNESNTTEEELALQFDRRRQLSERSSRVSLQEHHGESFHMLMHG